MLNKYIAIGFIIGLVLGIIGMILLDKNSPKPETDIYDLQIKKYNEKIKKDSLTIVGLKNRREVIHDTIETIKTKYVTIYKEIDRANPDELDRAFDTLLTD